MESDTDTLLLLFYSQIESKANDFNGDFLFLSTFSKVLDYDSVGSNLCLCSLRTHICTRSLARSLAHCVCKCVNRILSNEYLHPHIHGICAFNRSRIIGQTMELNEMK